MALALLGSGSIAACEENDPIEDAADEIGDAADDAADELD
jgi:hypothetical protein